jgi:diadenosine tetraphosphate (Ap4A) HIT family hydrolase
MSTLIHRRVEDARRGLNPRVIGRSRSGWVVLGDRQVTRGYCLLLPDPVVPTLNDLRDEVRRQYLDDMAAIGDALLDLTGAVRMNYEILGNLEPALHAHIFPRYADEHPDLRAKPIWFYDWDAAEPFDAIIHGPLMNQIRDALESRGVLPSRG